MTFRTTAVWCFATVTITLAEASFAQQPPYDVFPSDQRQLDFPFSDN